MKKFALSLLMGMVMGGASLLPTANAQMQNLQLQTRQEIAGPNGLVVRGESRFNSASSRTEIRSIATGTRNGGTVTVRAFLWTAAGARINHSSWVTGRTQITARSGWSTASSLRAGGEML